MPEQTYSIYEIIQQGLLLNRTGKPYKSHNQVREWVKKHGVVKNGERPTFDVPISLIKEHNNRVRQFLELSDLL